MSVWAVPPSLIWSILLYHCPSQISHPGYREVHFWLVQWKEVGTVLYQPGTEPPEKQAYFNEMGTFIHKIKYQNDVQRKPRGWEGQMLRGKFVNLYKAKNYEQLLTFKSCDNIFMPYVLDTHSSWLGLAQHKDCGKVTKFVTVYYICKTWGWNFGVLKSCTLDYSMLCSGVVLYRDSSRCWEQLYTSA